jgi:hypothetical protein
MWLTLYILSVLVSAGIQWRKYLSERRIYRFSAQDKILGLAIVPLIPVVNLIVAMFSF